MQLTRTSSEIIVTNEDITMLNVEYLIQCKVEIIDIPIIEDEKEDYPPYVEKLHPRKDYQRKPFWMRIRSNPFKAGYLRDKEDNAKERCSRVNTGIVQ